MNDWWFVVRKLLGIVVSVDKDIICVKNVVGVKCGGIY